jgi:hypothetical protein
MQKQERIDIVKQRKNQITMWAGGYSPLEVSKTATRASCRINFSKIKTDRKLEGKATK